MTSRASRKRSPLHCGRPLVLASASPRRAWLLREAGIEAEVVPPPPEVEETVPQASSPVDAAMMAARAKALAVARLRPDALVLGADTVVAIGERILGKPADAAEACAMLRDLAGRAHEVYTALAYAASLGSEAKILAEDVVSSEVVFRQLSEEEIAAYVATGEPADKAGAYAIQGEAGRFVAQLKGAWDNVVGLPVARAVELLTQVRLELSRLEEDG